MQNLDLPIVVVDDAKFSSTIIAKTLRQANYLDIRTAHDGPAAIELLRQRPASVLVADWLMPGMDGLELTQKVRDLDKQTSRFTYVILLTAKETPEALTKAFTMGVDDFVFKSDMSKQLLPRVFAGGRIAETQNSLLTANQLLIDNNRHLEQHSTLDPDTGVGNQRYAQDSLAKLLKHTESRGQVSCYIRIDIQDWDSLKANASYVVNKELIAGIARRLRSQIRPLDVLSRIDDGAFAIIAQFKHMDDCKTSIFKRLLEGVNLNSFRTSTGFHSVRANLSVCCVDEGAVNDKGQPPSAPDVMKKGEALIETAQNQGGMSIFRWDKA